MAGRGFGTKDTLRLAPILLSVLIAFGGFAASASGVTYSVTATTVSPSYSGTQQIMIHGIVTPAPGPNTAVIVTVINPTNSTVDIQDDPVDASTGGWSQVTVGGGSLSCSGTPCWVAGTYVINATWGGDNSTAVGKGTFTYSPTVTTSSSSSSSTTTSTSTTSSSSSSTTTTSSSSSSKSSSSSSTLSVSTTTTTETEVVTLGSTSSSSTTTSAKASGSSLGSYLLPIVIVVVVILVLLGLVIWRRRVASSYAGSVSPQSATLRASSSLRDSRPQA